MIVLKHLACEFIVDPYHMREKLREEFGNAPNGRWKWEDENDPQYKKIHAYLTTLYGNNTTASEPEPKRRSRARSKVVKKR